MKKISKPIIVGNWKATPANLKDAINFVKALDKKISGTKVKKSSYLLAVPDVFINPLAELTSNCIVGAQNLTGIQTNQETGLNSPTMITSAGAEFVILGHSEVRKRGENSDIIAQKLETLLNQKITTILCLGEEERDKDGGYLNKIETEIRECLRFTKKETLENLIIAYEPVWAIGAKKGATTAECFEVVIAIRRALAENFGMDYAKKINVLYGGTVTEDNAVSFIEEASVDGLLIGRASQDVLSFSSIIKSFWK